MNFRIAVLAMFLLVGCKSQKFTGHITAFQDFQLGNQEVATGDYKSTIKIKSQRKMKFVIEGGSTSGDDVEFEIKFNQDFEDYAKGDSIIVPANDSNLGYELGGNIEKVKSVGQKQRDYEPCTYQEPYTVCYPTGRRGGVSCHTQWRTVHGYRDVEFKEESVVTTLHLAIYTMNSDDVNDMDTMAGMTHENTETNRLYSYTGICR